MLISIGYQRPLVRERRRRGEAAHWAAAAIASNIQELEERRASAPRVHMQRELIHKAAALRSCAVRVDRLDRLN
eukprot:6204883-Pleurochrysis_carterae.AAC.3